MGTVKVSRYAAVEQAIRAGKISPDRAGHWRRVWDADPEGTEALFGELWPVLPSSTRSPFEVAPDRCPVCNDQEWITVMSPTSRAPMLRQCGGCGSTLPGGERRMVFRRWVGQEVHVVQAGMVVTTVWCGPPAPYPDPPSPEDILRACGIDPAGVFCE